MDKKQFEKFRNKLKKTQKEISQLLGVSIKAVQSYEQGWRGIPVHIERQVFYLYSKKFKNQKSKKHCWIIKNCPKNLKENCPAWEFKAGQECWFINGTVCHGIVQKTWKEKIKMCRSCEIFKNLFSIFDGQKH
jgi:DNA-binding XRE family transcriptional regulator